MREDERFSLLIQVLFLI